MGIGAGSGIAGSAVPPQIRDSETTAFVETHKAQLAIVPADSYQVVPFTQQDAHMFYRYDAKSSDPMIMSPPLQMRMASAEAEGEDLGWVPIYDSLMSTLSSELRELLSAEDDKPFTMRNAKLVAFNNLLVASSKFLNWVETVSVPPVPNSPAAVKNELYAYVPEIAKQGVIENMGNVLSGVQSQLGELGANFVSYDQIQNLSSQLNQLLPLFGTLNKKEAAGEDVKEAFVALADATHRLVEQNNKGGEFHILSAILSTFDTIAACSALDRGSATLLISSHITGLDTKEALGSILDQSIQGILGSAGSSLGEQLEELNSLQSGLKALRDG
jgi:hypothetical protein